MTKDLTETLMTAVDAFMLRAMAVLPSLLATLVAFYLIHRLVNAGLEMAEKNSESWMRKSEGVVGEREKRIRTLFGITTRLANFLVLGVGALVVLQLFGVQIGPILAAAGVVGLAFSFGAQSLVKDVIAGVFMLIEDQVRIGDVAVINGQGGLVEEINLRTIVLRDLSGVVHVFPNGTITTLANMTKDWSAAVLDVGVAYKEDTDKVVAVMKEVAADLRKDEAFGPRIREDLEVFGVDAFGDSAVTIKCRIKTRPIEQWNVGREYRRRLKYAFDAAGIEIPFPHQTLYFGEASKPFEMLLRRDSESKSLEANG